MKCTKARKAAILIIAPSAKYPTSIPMNNKMAFPCSSTTGMVCIPANIKVFNNCNKNVTCLLMHRGSYFQQQQYISQRKITDKNKGNNKRN